MLKTHPEDGDDGAFCPGFAWPLQGKEVLAALRLNLAVQRGVKALRGVQKTRLSCWNRA